MVDNDDADDRIRHWAVIAQAEGVLAARHGLTVDEAAELLKLDAKTLGRPLSKIARRIIESRSAGLRKLRAQANGWHECGGAGD